YVAAGPPSLDPTFLYSTALIYRRVATPISSIALPNNPSQNPLVVQHMPANTPGMDCRAPDIIGRWLASIQAQGDQTDFATQLANTQTNAVVASFTSGCVPPPEVQNWVAEDLTEPKVYTPRRSDWNTWTHADDGIDRQLHPELIHGIPKELRDIAID